MLFSVPTAPIGPIHQVAIPPLVWIIIVVCALGIASPIFFGVILPHLGNGKNENEENGE